MNKICGYALKKICHTKNVLCKIVLLTFNNGHDWKQKTSKNILNIDLRFSHKGTSSRLYLSNFELKLSVKMQHFWENSPLSSIGGIQRMLSNLSIFRKLIVIFTSAYLKRIWFNKWEKYDSSDFHIWRWF